MPNTLIPQAFWFRVAMRCPRIDSVPRPGKKAPLLDLPESCRLPELARLEGLEPWAEIRVAWNTRGLAIQSEVTGKAGPIFRDEVLPDASDALHLWIDTRDTRDIHRATKFCHRYSAVLVPQGPRKLGVDIQLRKINRAAADPPWVKTDGILASAERAPAGWRMELFIPAEALHGFDPETNRRLGFYYAVSDPSRGDLFLAVGRDFPVAEDPSLWATLELIDKST